MIITIYQTKIMIIDNNYNGRLMITIIIKETK